MTNRNLKYLLDTLAVIGEKMEDSPTFTFNTDRGILEVTADKNKVTLLIYSIRSVLFLPHNVLETNIIEFLKVNAFDTFLFNSEEFNKTDREFLELLKVTINEYFESDDFDSSKYDYDKNRKAADEIISLIDLYCDELIVFEEESK